MTTKKNLAEINEYLETKDVRLQEIIRRLRIMMKKLVPDMTEGVNPWNIPTFYVNDQMCYYRVGLRHITFGFFWGTSLDDPNGLLEGTGKNLRHVKLRTIDDLNKAGLDKLILSAASFNRQNDRLVMGRKTKTKS
jgi:hypothetical protein